jgi:hypothetical protein
MIFPCPNPPVKVAANETDQHPVYLATRYAGIRLGTADVFRQIAFA